ncbi:hypothetical protein [Roseivirga sp. E12]|uniref:hypothetical protein n=1 Tax=Roseivirga sp. E12 TaxID=2819237 RepID=UPI001ABBFFB9|nr:hypothetical protein [Roseivirga sp. E12]MBO3700386.1 hypothetical protein [Roseivirga sp. E12]
MTKKPLFNLTFLWLLITACGTEEIYDFDRLLSEETAMIQNYLQENDLSVEEHPKGFFYKVISEGNDDMRAQDLDWVEFDLSVYDLDGTLYFSTDRSVELREGIKPPYYSNPYRIRVYDFPNKRPLEAIYDIAQLIGLRGEVEAFIPSNMAFGLTGYRNSIGGINGVRNIKIDANRIIRLEARITRISQ